jgi:hypothetical protein
MSLNYESLIERLSNEEIPAISTLSELSLFKFPEFIGFCSAKNLPLDLWAKMAVCIINKKKLLLQKIDQRSSPKLQKFFFIFFIYFFRLNIITLF